MDLFNKPNAKLPKIKKDAHVDAQIPDGLFLACPYCGVQLYSKQLGEHRVCPNCGYGFRLQAYERVHLMTTAFEEWDADLTLENPEFPGYAEKLSRAKSQTDLNESVLTGKAVLEDETVALGIMDSYFMMGSLGTMTGEKITRLFEKATEQELPVVLFTASGGARMQEGINSLMQMAKVSAAVAAHQEAGLPYFVVLTDPTTGGVTASFAMQGDVTLAEPHALVGFAGKRVIEQTIHEKVPKDFQRAETVLENGFIDAVVQRKELPKVLAQLVRFHQPQGGR
ncbi:acetyl-CoA carboxylase, carboxyltransferase subunit beta [Weissella paramesenteroides]|uniref:Acetyl-coenzyme A carboxylase carboxyl transferase subunit beta n=1 Tax=Weissella paramesenteroides TaxID=1249 RepID=A0ABD4XHD9_WEIPA|nr:acetyl-CoA carboxylase, carboxyltransferase subunit beta [Weissella paramesenteroides]MDF8368346.1 acetyl-CoA carboxylase, carboxyltransferase subunit beta [Weissella paramesenteroides]MDF8370465.1 acetyl-CoA carboxylase, carboxyltransferase subunit beta [Weissella paramesenteroides]